MMRWRSGGWHGQAEGGGCCGQAPTDAGCAPLQQMHAMLYTTSGGTSTHTVVQALTGGRPPLHQVHLVHILWRLGLHHIKVPRQAEVLLAQLGVAGGKVGVGGGGVGWEGGGGVGWGLDAGCSHSAPAHQASALSAAQQATAQHRQHSTAPRDARRSTRLMICCSCSLKSSSATAAGPSSRFSARPWRPSM